MSERDFPHSPYSFKRVLFVGAFAAGVALYFWTQSRYPALNMKALMGGRTATLGISFDVVLAPEAGDGRLLRVLKNTLNWYYTNWKGMTFGIVFGGALLSVLGMLRFRGFRNPVLNSAAGALFGAPLGVCANCTAPLSRVLQTSGYALETALGTLFGSPTLNVVVLSIAFTLLPLSMAGLKLALTAVMILVVIPILSRRLGGSKSPSCESAAVFVPVGRIEEGWLKALWESLKLLGRGVFFLFRTTVPQMLLAGLLGTALVEAFPLERLIQLPLSLGGALLLGFVGTFLPVPMSFDVILVAILLDGGLHPVYGMILLFTLGSFSVYPLILIAQSVSRRFAGALYASVALLGIAGGALYFGISGSQARQAVSRLEELAVERGRASDRVQEKLVDHLRASCGSLPGVYAEACVAQATVETGLKDVCALHGDPVRIRRCEVNLRGHEFGLAFEGCREFSDPAERTECVRGAFEAVAEQKLAAGRGAVRQFCRGNRDPDYVEPCRYVKSYFQGRDSVTTSTCERNGSEIEQRRCIFTLLTQRLFPSYDPSVCAGLGENGDNDYFCRSLVLLRASKHEDPDQACLELSDPVFRSHCLSLRAERKARNLRDPEICEQEALPAHRHRCLLTAYVAQARGMLLDANVKEASRIFGQASLTREPGSEEDGAPEGRAAKLEEAPLARRMSGTRVTVAVSPFQPKKPGSGDRMFSRHDAVEFGLRLPEVRPGELKGTASLVGRGVAAADFDRDGWQDLAFATRSGPYVYRNLGGLRFERVPISVRGGISAEDFEVLGVAWVDIDNDGRLDLFCSSLMGEAYFLLNTEEGFRGARRVGLPNAHDRSASRAFGFADVDRDGWLDVFLGSWTNSAFPYQFATSENDLFLNRKLDWRPGPYRDRIRGETLSVLMSDLNQDGAVDLWIANDMQAPDEIYMGAGKGRLREVRRSQGLLPYVPMGSMSYDSADINNDLRLDVFGSDVSFEPADEGSFCRFILSGQERARCEGIERVHEASKKGNIEGCRLAGSLAEQVDCAAAGVTQLAVISRRRAVCERIPDSAFLARRRCRQVFEYQPIFYDHPAEDIPQRKSNALYLQQEDGRFSEVARPFGVAATGWGWNGRFADFDNDGWQDLYVASGSLQHNQRGSNHFFLNDRGTKFLDRGAKAGIEEFFLSSAFAIVDLTNDGNLDIVSNAVGGPARVYLNASRGNSIGFALRSKGANPYQVGATIVIRHGEGKQMREIKASGGYLSFDPFEQHFGLGSKESVDHVSIRWADGAKTELEGPFAAGARYRITR